jgi:hypothetical protein
MLIIYFNLNGKKEINKNKKKFGQVIIINWGWFTWRELIKEFNVRFIQKVRELRYNFIQVCII